MSDTKPVRLSDKAEQCLLLQIHSGELGLGAKLPSKPALAVKMGLSRGILREAPEIRTVRYAIERATDEEIASLRELLKQSGRQPDSSDDYFHYRLAELAKNNLFLVFLNLKIVRSLEKRDKRAAASAVKRHLGSVLRRASEDSDA